MADPWLVHEVLRELDDANARYFALTLLSPSSCHYLVRIAASYMISCLPPCEFSAREFPACKFLCSPCAFKRGIYVGCGYITRDYVTTWVGISQEIPASFSAETGWPCDEECALVTSISTEKEWPLQVRRLPDVRGRMSAVSVGGGWAKFLHDQQLGRGAFMTFELVDERRLVVALHQRGAPEFTQQTDNVAGLVRDCCDSDLPEVLNTHPTTLTQLPEVRTGDRPQFQKILRKTHILKHASSRIVSAHPCCSPWRHLYSDFRVFRTKSCHN